MVHNKPHKGNAGKMVRNCQVYPAASCIPNHFLLSQLQKGSCHKSSSGAYSWERGLIGHLCDGESPALTIWNTSCKGEQDWELERLEQASSLLAGAQLTQTHAGIGELRVISSLDTMARDLLKLVLNE